METIITLTPQELTIFPTPDGWETEDDIATFHYHDVSDNDGDYLISLEFSNEELSDETD